MIYLAAGGSLRLNGPDTHGAFDMEIQNWGADPQADGVNVQWQPSQFAPGDTDPKTVHYAHLYVGKHLVIGQVVLTVSVIENGGAQHPAWIGFKAVPAS